MKKIYVTKYCLTKKGIYCVDWDELKSDSGIILISNNAYWSCFTLGNNAFLTKEEANQDAEKRRVKKIESLQKQISKLEKLNFK